MPGFQTLPEHFTGVVADLTGEGELLEKNGQQSEAIATYERALATALADDGEIPAFLCGRLATLYRQTGRLTEEVELLERFERTQTSDRERIRFAGRLSKARALLQKQARVFEYGALAAIRSIRPSSYSRRSTTLRKRGDLGGGSDSAVG